MKLERFFLAATNIVSVIIGVFLGLALYDVSAGAAFVYQWQTLIAGVLAIIAALFTIGQMKVSDARQEERHRQNLFFEEDKKALIARRAGQSVGKELRRHLAFSLSRMDISDPNELAKGYGEWHAKFASLSSRTTRIVNRRALEQARALFPPEAEDCVDNLEDTLRLLENVVRINQRRMVEEQAQTVSTETARMMIEFKDHIHELLPELIEYLVALQRHHEMQSSKLSPSQS